MNLLPAVEAYLAERQTQLRAFDHPNFQAIRELESVAILCRGLAKQSEAIDKMLEPVTATPSAARTCSCPPGQHLEGCPLHPRNLTKL
jgi:hypothetical protein